MSNFETPSVRELVERLETPRHELFGPVPIWWWSGDQVTRERLRWQMEQMLSQGIAQAVVMNLAPSGPLYGSLADDPAFMSEGWWELFLGACRDADELGFKFWPYDQIGFSGANFQGRLVTGHPEWAGQALGRVVGTAEEGVPFTITVPHDAHALAAYVVTPEGRSHPATITGQTATWDGVAGTLSCVYWHELGFDYFNADAVRELMDSVHGEFERRAGAWFGKVIVGFFQDELPSMPTWGGRFGEEFRAASGYDLLPRLGALWGDPSPEGVAGPSDDEVRLDYERRRAAASRSATFDQFDAWFARHDLQCGFDQQSPAREGDPVGSVGVYADYLATHAGFSAPGADHLGDPKVHSSLAHLSGGTRSWLEGFHSTGWGGTLEETYDWIAPFYKRGATLYDPHAVYYSTAGGWWEWAPPSTCWRQPYWPEYHLLSSAVTRLSELLSQGSLVCDTALVFPTATVQAGFTFAGPTADGREATAIYHQLNGSTAWASERPGVLDRAGHEYEIVDDGLLGEATVDASGMQLRGATFTNVVLPSATVLDDRAAATLAELVDAGGRVVIVGSPPRLFTPEGDGAERLRALIEAGRVRRVMDPEAVPAELARTAPWVDADVPSLLRRVGDVEVVALFAHDERSGTVQPIFQGTDGYMEWIEESWASYWEGMRRDGYHFAPVADRRTRVRLHGAASGSSVQRWSPLSGERVTLPVEVTDGVLEVDVDFRDGSVALLVVGAALPQAEPDVAAPTTPSRAIELTDWTVLAQSGLDNRWGDFGARDRDGVLPIEIWELESAAGEAPADADWTPVVATFGAFARVSAPSAEPDDEAEWTDAVWSLSRGIPHDPVHQDTLGPKGYVPEEFVHWPDVRVGQWVRVRTSLDVGEGDVLSVGANAHVRVVSDGAAIPVVGRGYGRTAVLPPGRHEIELRFRAEYDEPIRASFALVRDQDAFSRAEWLVPVDGSVEATTVITRHEFELDQLPVDARIQVGAEQPCTVVINGIEVGRQNAFHPYGGHREARFSPYDLRQHLLVGSNVLELRSVDPGRQSAVIVDSLPLRHSGLGILTGTGDWTAVREGRPVALAERSRQWGDPRLVCLEPRPHPLPRAGWLERPPYEAGLVRDAVPDLDPSDRRPRRLRAPLPAGTTSIAVSSELPFEATIGTEPVDAVDGVLSLSAPSPVGTMVELVFPNADGRRGGAMLEHPLRVRTSPVAATLGAWTELGLDSLAGEVRYSTTIGDRPSGRVRLDLGQVRGSVQVLVNGEDVARFAWGPYLVDITDHLAPIDNVLEVRVRGTLAPYLDVASPTPGVFARQKVTGLFGPVRLVTSARS